MQTILFYATTEPYGAFSNFAKYTIEIDGQIWPTSEHYYQSQKFVNTSDQDDVCKAKTAFVAAQIGRERNRTFRSDWDAAKDAVMMKALEAKFSQHADIRDILCSTGDAILVEHTANDSYWADGGDGTGKNRLGTFCITPAKAEVG
jgi:N-glycosidase YbiA